MADTIEALIAQLDAFTPTDDSIDNEEKLQIWVDRWEEAPDKEKSLPAMLALFERYPETNTLGEPGPLVHALEQVPGYEEAMTASITKSPSYYGVWMVNRILDEELPPATREFYITLLRQVADNENTPASVQGTAREFLGFQGG